MSTITEGITLPQLEADGKLVVTPAPNSRGFQTFYTGAGDALGPPIVRGGGTRLRLEWDANEARGNKDVDIMFAEPVELHDGEAYYTPAANWDVDDLLTFSVTIPANSPTPNGSNTGNCNLVDLGGYNMLVPAAGNGTHDIVLADAVPAPAPTTGGYWNANHSTGLVSANATPGAGEFVMLDVPFSAYFARNIPLGNALGMFAVDAYKVQWLHHKWTLRMSVNKQSGGAGKIAGWILAYREKTV